MEAQALQADFDLSFFKQYEGPISTERLPEDPAKRPHPNYLAKLNELLFAV